MTWFPRTSDCSGASTRGLWPCGKEVQALTHKDVKAMAVSIMQPETITQLWEQVLEAVRERLGNQQACDTWFRPIVPRHLSSQSVELEVPNALYTDWIHEHH